MFLHNISVGGITEDNDTEECLNSVELAKSNQTISHIKKDIAEKSRTGILWILYLDYVAIIKKYIIAERTSKWELHLATATAMLILFAATVHINYAKSSRLYIQQMREQQDTHPWLYRMFNNGFHAIRRSDSFWEGL